MRSCTASGEEMAICWPGLLYGCQTLRQFPCPFPKKCDAIRQVWAKTRWTMINTFSMHTWCAGQPSQGLCFWGHLPHRDLHQDLWSQMQFLQGQASKGMLIHAATMGRKTQKSRPFNPFRQIRSFQSHLKSSAFGRTPGIILIAPWYSSGLSRRPWAPTQFWTKVC